MTKKLTFLFCFMLLLGAGCIGGESEVIEEEASQSWFISFEQADGWYLAMPYQDGQDVQIKESISSEENEIFMQNTEATIWISPNAPSEEEIEKIGGEEAIVYDDFTQIRVVKLDKRRILSEDREQVAENFSRQQVCDTDCPTSKSMYRYYFEAEDNYQFDIYQSGQDLEVAEALIFSAVE